MQGNKHPKCKPIHIPIRTVVKNMTAVLTVFRCFLFKSKTFSANNYGIIVNNYFLSVNRFCTFGRKSSTFGKLYSKNQFFSMCLFILFEKQPQESLVLQYSLRLLFHTIVEWLSGIISSFIIAFGQQLIILIKFYNDK